VRGFQLILALFLLLFVIVKFGLWMYGSYCYVQALRHRRPGLPYYGMVPTPDQVLPAGRVYVRRWAIAWFAALGTTVLGAMLF
jgi:sterol desaturase/sphingolipid hydroxylase (fatty acid hydroxylase superfamily)